MQIEIQKDISKKLEKASKILGIKEQELIDRALLLYLDNISKYMELKKELRDWDKLSEEALSNFENLL